MVDRLMTFLGGQSTLALVKALPLALEVIQRRSMWTKLVRRVCPYDTDDGESDEEVVANYRSKVMNLVEILRMTEDPNPLLLDLLHIICKRFPSVDGEDLRQDMRRFVQVSCS